MELEECVKYWQDQVGPDSEEDKQWGANLGAVHWDMIQRFDRCLARTKAKQDSFADKETSLFDVKPLKMRPRSLLILYRRLMEEHKACRPITAWELIDSMKNQIKDKNASRVVPRVNEMFAESKEWAELQYWYTNNRLKEYLKEWIAYCSKAPLPVFASAAVYLEAIDARRLSVPMGLAVFGEDYAKFIKDDILDETRQVQWEEGSEWHTVVTCARQWAQEE